MKAYGLGSLLSQLLLDSGLSSGGSFLCDSSHVESRMEGEKWGWRRH